MRFGSCIRAFRVVATCNRKWTNAFPLASSCIGPYNATQKRGFGSDHEEYSPHWETPTHFNFAKDIVEKWALAKPDHTALWFTNGQKEHRVSYSELLQEAKYIATALRARGSPNLALVVLPKVLPWWVINVAGSWCGMIISPGTSMLRPHDISFRLSQSEADCLICDAHLARQVDDSTRDVPLRILVSENNDHMPGWVSYATLLEEGRQQETVECTATKGDDVAQLFFTSGTTGYPKMVPHTQASYGLGHRLSVFKWMNLRSDDVMWNVSDTGWAKAAWASLYIPFIAGATVFVHQMAHFDANVMVDTLHKENITVLCAPPTAYRALVQCDLSSRPFRALRRCHSAGEPLNPEVMYTWKAATGLDIREGYGQTEMTLLCANFHGMKVKEGSMGKISPEYDVKILDDDLNEVADGTVGQLAINLKERRPPGLFKGYMKNPKKNEEVFKGDYYLTGDKAYFDSDKYLWFVGRNDDVIISAGYRIGPFEIESALQEHPAVAESAVVASPDPLRGEVVKAFILLAQNEYRNMDRDQLAKELQDSVKKVTAPYKYPRKIEFVESLPKTVSEKIRRVELREREYNQS
ncbi:acyl-coenzyme A synthetase ACSM3, mitochondrial-like isoform X2 [Oratosquilla oratoria]